MRIFSPRWYLSVPVPLVIELVIQPLNADVLQFLFSRQLPDCFHILFVDQQGNATTNRQLPGSRTNLGVHARCFYRVIHGQPIGMGVEKNIIVFHDSFYHMQTASARSEHSLKLFISKINEFY